MTIAENGDTEREENVKLIKLYIEYTTTIPREQRKGFYKQAVAAHPQTRILACT